MKPKHSASSVGEEKKVSKASLRDKIKFYANQK